MKNSHKPRQLWHADDSQLDAAPDWQMEVPSKGEMMTIAQALIAFATAASLLIVTPGLDTAFVLRAAATGGHRRAAHACFGIALGCLVWGLIASVGLGALLAASEIAYTAVKWAGAAYLFWVGLKLITRPRQQFSIEATSTAPFTSGLSFRQGFFTNLLNPKIGIFYVTFLPQFVPPGVNVAAFSLLLTIIHVALSQVWFAILISATVPLGKILRRSHVVKLMDRVTGAVFVLFGAKLAFSRS